MDVQGFSSSHDYILCYVKQGYDGIRRETFTQNEGQFNFTDPETEKKYRRRSVRKEGSHSTRSERPNLWFPLTAPDGSEIFPVKPDGTEGCWRWSMDTYNDNNANGMVEWVNTEIGWQVYAKQFLDMEAVRPPQTLWFHQEVGHNHSAAEAVKKLLEAKAFDSPKPKDLIIKMLKIASSSDDDIILDFFAGSSTTAHAVMQLNNEDGGNRRFIMVQLPEPTSENTEAYKVGYQNICEIGKERIRRAGAKVLEEQNGQINFDEDVDKPPLDVGFKVFKLDTSNLKLWDDTPVTGNSALAELEARLRNMLDIIKSDRSEMDVVYEIMLKLGQELTEPITPIGLGNGKVVYGVGAEIKFIVCLAQGITPEDADAMAEYKPGRIIFADACFENSEQKSNVKLTLRDKGIAIKALTGRFIWTKMV
jgi:adenine-specific DNA-methyltransferase